MNAGPPIAVTLGEPAGVGPELVAMAWLARREHVLAPFYCLGDADFLARRFSDSGLGVPLETVADASLAAARFENALPVVPLAAPVTVGHAGRPDAADAAAVIESVERAVSDIGNGQARAMVTAPIQKETLYAAGFGFPGHTEHLGALTRSWPGGGGPPVMMLAAESLRVVPVTVHVPIAKVTQTLTTDLVVTTGRIVADALRLKFAIPRPRLAVSGLNPHAGEGGKLGSEDRDIVAPAVARLHAEGIDARGPLPADTMFHPQARRGYDAALMMYHDQALIPIKTLAFDSAVNLTLGLPLIRTSPDHGTALDIAGTGAASPSSFIAALRLADTLSRAS